MSLVLANTPMPPPQPLSVCGYDPHKTFDVPLSSAHPQSSIPNMVEEELAAQVAVALRCAGRRRTNTIPFPV